MSDIEIRRMSAHDLPAARAILAAWNMAPLPQSEMTPEPERSCIEVENAFVAVEGGRVVGMCSFLLLGGGVAETASLAVDHAFLRRGIGFRLQAARLAEMRRRGIRRVCTEADRPETIRWYVERFGYRVVGTNPKKHDFGSSEVDQWTVLELDLEDAP